MRGKPFLKKRFFPSNSPFQKTLARGENLYRTTDNQSAKIRLIRKIRVLTDPRKTIVSPLLFLVRERLHAAGGGQVF